MPVPERDRDERVARLADERAHALALGAEDERNAAGEVELPERRSAVGDRRVRPEVVTLDLGQVAGEIRHDGDREMLDRAGGRAADGGGDTGRTVRG